MIISLTPFLTLQLFSLPGSSTRITALGLAAEPSTTHSHVVSLLLLPAPSQRKAKAFPINSPFAIFGNQRNGDLTSYRKPATREDLDHCCPTQAELYRASYPSCSVSCVPRFPIPDRLRSLPSNRPEAPCRACVLPLGAPGSILAKFICL